MLQVITRSSNYKWWAFGAISVGIFNMVMDQSAAIVAIPTIAGDFDADIPTVQWILVGYALVISALLLPMGRLSDMIGLKKVYTAGFAIFVLGAVLAGISPNITMLILSRLLQGLGSAMTQGDQPRHSAVGIPWERAGEGHGPVPGDGRSRLYSRLTPGWESDKRP